MNIKDINNKTSDVQLIDKRDKIAVIFEFSNNIELVDVIMNFYNALKPYNWRFRLYHNEKYTTQWKELFEKTNIIIELYSVNINLDDTVKIPYYETILHTNFVKSLSFLQSLNATWLLTFNINSWILNPDCFNPEYFINGNYSYVGGSIKNDLSLGNSNNDTLNMSWYIPLHTLKITKYNCPYIHSNFYGGLSLRKIPDMIEIVNTYPPSNMDMFGYGNNLAQMREDIYFSMGAYFLNKKISDDYFSSFFVGHIIIIPYQFAICDINIKIYPELLKIYPYLKDTIYQKRYDILEKNTLPSDILPIVNNTVHLNRASLACTDKVCV